jgi:protein phosphatase
VSALVNRKPRDDEIDIHALTHPGLVRKENQDHFLICQMRPRLDVVLTSLPEAALPQMDAERLAFLAMVADGVGGGQAGETASRSAVEAVTRYIGEAIHTYYTADASDEASFAESLSAATLRVHEDLVRLAQSTPDIDYFATTLTMLVGLWPRAYVVQVGDSRYYLCNKGTLRQISRDQTVGQDLVDSGALGSDHPAYKKWSRMLSSSIGGSESRPVVSSFASDWDNVHLMCSDGLTRHVSDARIRERLATMTSAKQACEGLLQDALDGGGRDNVTLIVARTLRRDLA